MVAEVSHMIMNLVRWFIVASISNFGLGDFYQMIHDLVNLRGRVQIQLLFVHSPGP